MYPSVRSHAKAEFRNHKKQHLQFTSERRKRLCQALNPCEEYADQEMQWKVLRLTFGQGGHLQNLRLSSLQDR